MRRRDVLGLVLALAATRVQAQTSRAFTVGYLWQGREGTGDFPRRGLIDGLAALGYREGNNLSLHYRYADQNLERLPALAAELVALRVDVIRAPGTLVTEAAIAATATIPIVTTAADLVGTGFVESLARPGRNVTGVGLSLGTEITTKRVEILRDLDPAIRRIGFMHDPNSAASSEDWSWLEAHASALGIEVIPLRAARSADFEGAFSELAAAQGNGLIVNTAPVMTGNRKAIIAGAEKAGVAAIYGRPEYVADGGLMALGISLREVQARVASLIDRILRGADPATLPVEQPTRFELLLNRGAARRLGLAFPPSLLARADEVLE